MGIHQPTEEDKAARLAMLAALGKFNLEPMKMLALMSYTVGQLIALQDQTKVTPEKAMAMVARNIELGNQDAIAGIINTKGSA